METLGKRILELSRVLNLQQKDLAKALGWAENAHSKLSIIENDKSKPAYDFLKIVLEVFPQVNAEWLIKGTGSMFVDGYATENDPAVVAKKEKPTIKGDGLR